jgi:16S rRNA (cytosine967-C5)-methyltransferase
MEKPDHSGNQLRIISELLRRLLPMARRDPSFADRLRQKLRRDRRFGARDRRIYREVVYAAVRHLPWVEAAAEERRALLAVALAEPTPDLAPLREAVLPSAGAIPADLAARATWAGDIAGTSCDVEALFPAWVAHECPLLATPAVQALQLQRAHLWLRLPPGDPGGVLPWLQAEGIVAQPGPIPEAWSVHGDADLSRSPAYANGQLEFQDIGSQLVLALGAVEPHGRWLDACAGAGGKTLQLAARLAARGGVVVAQDVRPRALAELRHRVERAGLHNVTINEELIPESEREPVAAGEEPVVRRPVKPAPGTFQGVLVDAPCSGSGTWRRQPHLRWQTTPQRIAKYTAQQRQLLEHYALYVAPGGVLLYATCSLATRENGGVVDDFLAAHPEFVAEPIAPLPPLEPTLPGTTIAPTHFDSDGFYVARLHRVA